MQSVPQAHIYYPKEKTMNTARELEAHALQEAAAKQREYERKRSILMDEAVLIVTMIRQRIALLPGEKPITGDGMLNAVATLYAALAVEIREDVVQRGEDK